MPQSLPPHPDLEQLRKQAKDLLKSFRAGDADAFRRFRDHHPEARARATERESAAPHTLADAQLVLAREHGFASWPQLREHVETVILNTRSPMEVFKQAFHTDDAALFARLLERHPAIRLRLNEPIGPFDSPPIIHVKSREMLDVFLAAGADLNAKSRWWAGGFGLLHTAPPPVAAHAIGRGAIVDVHAAARLGLAERLKELITADPSLVHARGGDGQTPLHFAASVEIADLLLAHGANLDVRDVDHESTPAQWMLGERTEVARHLVQRGCRTDILLASAVGDLERVRQHLDADPDCIHIRVNEAFFPKSAPRSGGTIYQWTLGRDVSASDVAQKFDRPEVLRLLLSRSPAEARLVPLVVANDLAAVQELLAADPGLLGRVLRQRARALPDAARDNQFDAVQRLLVAGWPVNALGQHQGTALHWAAFHGNREMTEVLLAYQPELDRPDADHRAPPVGWATFGSEHGWHRATGDFPGVVDALLRAGARPPAQLAGTPEVRAMLRRHGVPEQVAKAPHRGAGYSPR